MQSWDPPFPQSLYGRGGGGRLVYKNNQHSIFLMFTAVVNCFRVTIKKATNSYEVDASHSSWPDDGFCRILGDPYTMTIELMNVIGADGVNGGLMVE